MIVSGQLLLADDVAKRCFLQPGTIRIVDEQITEVTLGSTTERADIGGNDHFITPGLIDTHLHLPQFDLIGAHGMPLLRWLDEVVFPAEIKWSDPDYARNMTERVAR